MYQNTENCKLYKAVSKRLCHSFARHLLAICSSNAAKWVKVWLLLSKPCLFSLNISFSSSEIKLYHLQTAPPWEFYEQKILNVITLAALFNISCCVTVDNMFNSHVGGPGFNSRGRRLFSLFLVVFFCFL